MKTIKSKISPIKLMAAMLFVVFGLSMILAPASPKQVTNSICIQKINISSKAEPKTAIVDSGCSNGGSIALTDGHCGSGTDAIATSVSFGCEGDTCVMGTLTNPTPPEPNAYCTGNNPAITDLIFAIIRFLSDGVGIVVIGSIIVGGLQYIGSRGEPTATGLAINRIRGAIIALIIYIFGYAILNYVIPIGFFNIPK